MPNFSPYTAEENAIAYKRKLAEALQQQGMEAINPNRMSGGWAIPISPFEGLAKLAQTYVGAKGMQGAAEQEKALGARSQTESQQALMAALAHSGMNIDPETARTMGTLGSNPNGAAYMPLLIKALMEKQKESRIKDAMGESQGEQNLPPAMPPPASTSRPPLNFEGEQPVVNAMPPANMPQNMPQPNPIGIDMPRPVPSMQAPAGAAPIIAPPVDVTAKSMPDYQKMAAEARAMAKRLMPIDPQRANDLLASADRLQRLGMEKDVKPIVNEHFPISETREQPHEQNRQTGQWTPLPGSQPRPIFSPTSQVTIDQTINSFMPASEEAQREFMKSTRATYDQLKNAPALLASIEKAKALIPGASGFMGPGGESLLAAAKFLNNRIGTTINTEGVKDAEELRTRIFFNVMENLKKMDAQPSQQQQQIMQNSLGKLGTDPSALPAVLDAFADVIRDKADLHNKEVNESITRGIKFPYDPLIKLSPKKTDSPTKGGGWSVVK